MKCLEKNTNQRNFSITSLTATDLQFNNSQIFITDLDLDISTSQSFPYNLTYSHTCGSNYKQTHHLLILICQHKSQDVKLYCCQCEVLSQYKQQIPSNTTTICYLTYHRFCITINSKKANTTAAQIMTQ